jgi:fused signal recognition particle receptor
LFGIGKKQAKKDDAPAAAAPVPASPAAATPAPSPAGIFARIKNALGRTGEILNTPVGELFGSADRDKAYADLELALIRADVGADLSSEIVKKVRAGERSGAAAPMDLLRSELLRTLSVAQRPVVAPGVVPRVIFLVGVNGTGKTTTMGKLAALHVAAGERPIMVACDTFRAAAIEQLGAWADRAKVPLVRQSTGADPAAVLHDGLSRARERGESPVLVDTAGRLHVKSHLMEEMAKMGRVAARLVEGAPHECYLVLDATTGQNGLAQAREFGKAIPLTGVVLTKLDGTAKGGVAFAIARELGLPIRHVGVGEAIDDLLPFDAEAYVEGLLGARGSR